MLETTSAIIFASLSLIVIAFQACLAAGLPWGKASMGGKYPGKYPTKMRVVAIVNMFVLAFLALIVLAEAQFFLPELRSISGFGIWLVVGFSLLATILNTITPSKIERIWAPVGLIQLVTSLIIALN